jgi:hypothetical protein
MSSKTWNVRDDGRVITFEGVKLAETSSKRPNVTRWTDMALYKTDTGKYVFTKVGRTVVLHDPACPDIVRKLNLFMDEYPDRDPEDGFDLHSCIGETYYMDEILVEQTRFWAFIAESAEAVVDALHKNEGGMRFLPRMSINLLEAAIPKDVDLAAAYTRESRV